MADPTRDRELKNALAQIENQFGKGAIMQLGDSTALDIQGIPTGALSLDIALGGKGALLSGDIVRVGPDKKVSFMRSYPDLIPLDAGSVQHIANVLDGWEFDAIYGAMWDSVTPSDGKPAVAYSVGHTDAPATSQPVAVATATIRNLSSPLHSGNVS